jgi:mannose-1-phosphate guanylyltransferase/phosphomannomutase
VKIAILAGGKGTRLGLVDRPKPMVPIAGKPLLEHLLDVGKSCGFRDYVFLNGHLSEVIEQYFGNGDRFGVSIEHVNEVSPKGTAGAVKGSKQLLEDPFVLLYGDILVDVDLKHLSEVFQRKGGTGAIFVHPNDHPFDSDLVEIDDGQRITKFLPKPHDPHVDLPNLVSAALYVLDPEIFEFVPDDRPSDWVHDVFPKALQAGHELYAYQSMEYAKDIGTVDRLKRAEVDIRSGRVARLSRKHAKPAVFFDRDGVLNEEINGVHRPDDLVLRSGVGKALKTLNQIGIPAICVTNQPDVAKGFLTLKDLKSVFDALDTKLGREGAYLDQVYYCPHHPERGWPGEVQSMKIVCDCRKPAPGLLKRAAADHNLDLSRSWLVGDRRTDIEAAHAVGAKAILLTDASCDEASDAKIAADFVAYDIETAVAHILSKVA